MGNLPSVPDQKRRLWAQNLLNWGSYLGRPPVLSAIGTAVVVLSLRAAGALQGLELGMYDQMMRLRPVPEPDSRLLIVGISEADIQSRQEWPIQDSTLAAALDILLAAEPRAVGLDMFRDVAIDEGQATLWNTIQKSDRVVPVCKISSPDSPGVPPPAEVTEMQVGFSDLVVDAGGILRRNLLIAAPPADSQTVNTHLCNSPEVQLFSLSLQLALHYLAAEGIQPALTANQELQLGTTVLPRLQANLGGYHNVDASGYQVLLNYRAAKAAVPQVSLSDLLSGTVEPETIRDRIVLIGATTPEAKDEFYTPFSGGLADSQKMPGVMVHAQAVSQLLSAVLDGRPLLWSWSTLGEIGWILVWGLGGAVFAGVVHRPVPFALGTVGLLGGLYGLAYVGFLQGGWIPLVPAGMALILAAGGVVLLERFNRSGYGQAMYRQVKTLLRFEIDIDHTQVGQQVAEITDTDYFNELQAQAKMLREKRRTHQTPPSATDRESSSPTAPPKAGQPTETVDEYVDKLKHQANRLNGKDLDSPE
jgi:adenylate cyclase